MIPKIAMMISTAPLTPVPTRMCGSENRASDLEAIASPISMRPIIYISKKKKWATNLYWYMMVATTVTYTYAHRRHSYIIYHGRTKHYRTQDNPQSALYLSSVYHIDMP